ncbi:hypothetical protein NDU88_006130 [Pleurodeles waltl]|uniref:Uncharacterized protein n=1 Tax=Pleurodeles waltl TaxID=8319 RepID=A0AAV7TVY7_PLEWA|nr:hypothetical protein NDU88_006130 [Pleurodeles waltl]
MRVLWQAPAVDLTGCQLFWSSPGAGGERLVAWAGPTIRYEAPLLVPFPPDLGPSAGCGASRCHASQDGRASCSSDCGWLSGQIGPRPLGAAVPRVWPCALPYSGGPDWGGPQREMLGQPFWSFSPLFPPLGRWQTLGIFWPIPAWIYGAGRLTSCCYLCGGRELEVRA